LCVRPASFGGISIKNKSFELKEFGLIKYFICKELSDTDLVVNAFTTRKGGISRKPFDSLNLAYNVGDKEREVTENRKLILEALGINYPAVVAAQQVHQDRISLVKKEDKGKGAFKYSPGIPQSDALITNVPGIPLLMCYADCVPIFILDPVKKAIALIHSGRRGTELEITLKTLNQMQKAFGTDPSCCLAAIFPSIGPCCYRFKDLDKIDDYWVSQNNFLPEEISALKEKGQGLDLKKAIYRQLIKVGVKEKNISRSEICTADHSELFFSYRRDKGHTGRMAAIFMLK